MNAGSKVLTVKDSYELGDNVQSKVLAFAFGLVAEPEREMISKRTKEVLLSTLKHRPPQRKKECRIHLEWQGKKNKPVVKTGV